MIIISLKSLETKDFVFWVRSIKAIARIPRFKSIKFYLFFYLFNIND